MFEAHCTKRKHDHCVFLFVPPILECNSRCRLDTIESAAEAKNISKEVGGRSGILEYFCTGLFYTFCLYIFYLQNMAFLWSVQGAQLDLEDLLGLDVFVDEEREKSVVVLLRTSDLAYTHLEMGTGPAERTKLIAFLEIGVGGDNIVEVIR